ncbi:hypothetical protein [Hyphomonas sp.]|uniref:hypothetical protein n=1 Tax=Hyphomonas sp. TaxID=87 RepID=UPI0037BE806F
MDGEMMASSGSKKSLSRDKRAKFVELAESRTSAAIRAIRVIGKLGNKAHYEFTESDVKKITQALSREIDELKVRLMSKGTKAQVEFKL